MNIREIKALLLLSLFVFSTMSFAKVNPTSPEIAAKRQTAYELQDAIAVIKNKSLSKEEKYHAITKFRQKLKRLSPKLSDTVVKTTDENIPALAERIHIAAMNCDIEVTLRDSSGNDLGSVITKDPLGAIEEFGADELQCDFRVVDPSLNLMPTGVFVE